MKTLLLLILFINGIAHSQSTTVYVCSGPKVKKYHLTETCRGLSNCQHRIVKSTLQEAQKGGKSLCGWEK